MSPRGKAIELTILRCMKKIVAFVAECFNQNVTSVDWTLEYSLDHCNLLWRHFSRRVAVSIICRITRRLLCSVTRLCIAALILGFAGPVVHSQNPADNFVHWGYASYFGTG